MEPRDVTGGVFHAEWGIPSSLGGQCGCGVGTSGKLPLCACCEVPMWGGGSSWQPGASWLSNTEVKPVSCTDRLVQGWRADWALRQMGPKLVLIYPEVVPLWECGKDPPSFSVVQIVFFFFLSLMCLICKWRRICDYELRISQDAFLSFVTIDRFSACFLSSSSHCSEPAQGLLTSSLSRVPKLMKCRWIHFSLWRKNILTLTVRLLCSWENCSGCSTNSFHSIKTHTLLITESRG